MRRIVTAVLAYGLLTGAGCPLVSGCSVSYKTTGITHAHADVAGIDEETAALMLDAHATNAELTIKGDPLAFGERVVHDVGELVRAIIAQFDRTAP